MSTFEPTQQDQEILDRVDLPAHLKDMIHRYWLANPPPYRTFWEKIARKINTLLATWLTATIIVSMGMIILCPLVIEASDWIVELGLLLGWIAMILSALSLPIGLVELSKKVQPEQNSASWRELMDRETIQMLLPARSRLQACLGWLLDLAMVGGLVAQDHKNTAMALIAFLVLFQSWLFLCREIIRDGLRQFSRLRHF